MDEDLTRAPLVAEVGSGDHDSWRVPVKFLTLLETKVALVPWSAEESEAETVSA